MNEELHRIIQDRILFLEYEPGQILNEKVLAKEFGISRTPLREVLNRLEWEQLVRILPRTGTMVSEIEYQKIMNVYQVRLEIEAMAGRLAAEHITPDHLERLAALEDRCAALSGDMDKRALITIDAGFRAILHEAADNDVLGQMSAYLYHLTIRLWYVTIDRKHWEEELRSFIDEIRQSRVILRNRDTEGMAELRRTALLNHLERIRSRFLGIG